LLQLGHGFSPMDSLCRSCGFALTLARFNWAMDFHPWIEHVNT